MKRYLALRDAWIRLHSFAGLGFFFFGEKGERESSVDSNFLKVFLKIGDV